MRPVTGLEGLREVPITSILNGFCKISINLEVFFQIAGYVAHPLALTLGLPGLGFLKLKTDGKTPKGLLGDT
jgi:hypothetical protein